MSIPHDLDAERAVLGAMLHGYTSSDTRSALLGTLAAEDFWLPAHQAVFAALGDLHGSGSKIDTILVRDQLARNGASVTDDVLLACQVNASAAPLRASDVLVRLSVARKLLSAAEAISADARSGMGPDEMIDRALEAVGAIDLPDDLSALPDGVSTVDDFLAAADTTPTPWVVPGLLRAGWRALLVAPEGLGKSVTARLIAIAAAQGVHPFTHRPIPAVRTLIVDLENPDDAIAQTCKPITDRTRAASTAYDDGRAWMWRSPAGVDIRQRADRRKLQAVIAAVQPDLVCIGPMYKLYRVAARESDELASGEVQAILDDLRTRHNFALLLEHHAPKSSGMGPRDLLPYGSSLWLRWPELGLTMKPGDPDEGDPADSVRIGRFRRDRMDNSWPDRLDRGRPGDFPWTGYWRNGNDDLR